jgi:Zn-dependent M28 family amino/carboxypeptidase
VDAGALRDREQYRKLDLSEKIAVSSIKVNIFRLMFKKPKVVTQLSPKDFQKAKVAESGPVEIVIAGTHSRIQSANVIDTLSPDSATKEEVILSAHLDSWSGPGAADNASGVGVLLELARHLGSLRRQLPFRVKFVAFGGEEVGMMGSKAYLQRHLADLKHCRLLFNMDSIGGNKMFVEMRGGVRNVPDTVENRFPEDLLDKASSDIAGKWMMNRSDALMLLDASNVPEWLQAAIKSTTDELGYEFTAANGMGSDHRVFTQAGIVSTNIALSGSRLHSPEDVPEQINIESLEKCARIVLGVLGRIPATD